MSRRTKYIIAALFLVLLAIPAVYLFLTWIPEQPLRFRVVRERLDYSDDRYRVVEVEVLNTSRATIVLCSARPFAKRRQDPKKPCGLFLLAHGPNGKDIIPSDDSILVELHLERDGISENPLKQDLAGEVEMEYTWSTRPKDVFYWIRDWVSVHLSPRLHTLVPLPSLSYDSGPLEDSPPKGLQIHPSS